MVNETLVINNLELLSNLGGALIGIASAVILFAVGTRIKDTIGDSNYQVFVWVSFIIGLFSTTLFFNFLNMIFGGEGSTISWMLGFGIYTPIFLIFLLVFAKITRIF